MRKGWRKGKKRERKENEVRSYFYHLAISFQTKKAHVNNN